SSCWLEGLLHCRCSFHLVLRNEREQCVTRPRRVLWCERLQTIARLQIAVCHICLHIMLTGDIAHYPRWRIVVKVLGAMMVKMSPNQEATLKVLAFDPWYKAPGKLLVVKPSGKDMSDIVIPREIVDEKGRLHSCGGLGLSLRKSIEHTVDGHLRAGEHGTKVASDTDVARPRYLLSGSIYPYDPEYDELWASPGRMCQWPAMYSWSPRLPQGLGWASLTQAIDLADAPDVFGYIYFFEVSNPQYYDTDRIVKVGQTAVNCPQITPENEGKVFARYGYRDAYQFGNIKTDGSEPDAYIFKGKALAEAQVKLVHTYRIMKPELPSATPS
ncbi:unnamed protein product, partial [Prorocentrum cordatum]